MADGQPKLTVFRIQREQPNIDDPGHIVVQRKVPSEVTMYRLPLKTPANEPKAVGEEVEPLLGDSWKKPVVRIIFIDGTAIELRQFKRDDLESPYQITKLVKGERLVSHCTLRSNTGVSLAFVNYPAKKSGCVLRVWDEEKGKKASSVIKRHKL